LSDDGCIDAEGAVFKLHYGHGLRCASKAPLCSPILSVSHFVRAQRHREDPQIPTAPELPRREGRK
jgi:hypothetical protein